MGCNNCNSDEEGMWGWCDECQERRVKRVRASIRASFWSASDDEEDEESQATLDSY